MKKWLVFVYGIGFALATMFAVVRARNHEIDLAFLDGGTALFVLLAVVLTDVRKGGDRG